MHDRAMTPSWRAHDARKSMLDDMYNVHGGWYDINGDWHEHDHETRDSSHALYSSDEHAYDSYAVAHTTDDGVRDIDGDAAGANDTRAMITTKSVLECCYTPILVLTLNVEDSGQHPRLRVHYDNDENAADKKDGNNAAEDNDNVS